MRNKQRSFTLLEILVVLGIIAILVAMGAISYSSVQKKARDAKRKTDLKTLQQAFEEYYSVCGFSYPTPSPGLSGITNISCPLTPTIMIMPKIPKEPLKDIDYALTSDGQTYTICVPTINPTQGPLETEIVTSYCLSNQQ